MLRLLSLFCACLMMMPAAAHAQAFGAAPEKTMTFGSNNETLDMTLKLQYQMQMIRRLIERERAVNAMIESALQIGVADPYIPDPDYVLCRQIPSNIICASAHEGIYENYSVKKIEPVLALPDMPQLKPIIPLNDATLPQEITQMAVVSETLYWMDITCLAADCSAVITPDPANANARYRIRIGDKLPDGATVDGISHNGVVLKRGKEQIELDPAPAA